MKNYIALLRGINVGGKNIIKMDRLNELFKEMGFSNIRTYIQSGNVIFNDTKKNKLKTKETIEEVLSAELKNEINIALLTVTEIKEVIDKKPEKFGEDNDKYKYDVIFLIDPLTAKDAAKEFDPRENVDAIYIGKKVLYISRLKKELNKSRFSKIMKSKIYSKLTIRNWNTTNKLHELANMELNTPSIK